MNLRSYISDVIETVGQLASPSDDLKSHRCKWREREFPCYVGSEHRSRDLTTGGWNSQVEISIYIRLDVLGDLLDASSTTLTADNDQITADSDNTAPRATKTIEVLTMNRTYRIQSVTTYPGAYLVLRCMDAYKP